MMIFDGKRKRMAYAYDFEDTSVTLTPIEWQDLLDFFEFKKKSAPSVFAKTTKSILKKLLAAKPKLKAPLKEADN
ncbi:MAG: hypothetical protein IKN82_08210 [Treponema sp.]|nr:hypothetical protein [Treponema sp.]